MKIRTVLSILVVLVMFASTGEALTIYPIHRAKIPAGGRFDFKVEFDQVVPKDKINITVNGQTYAGVLGAGQYVEKEDGVEASAVIVRGVALNRSGTYQITASDGSISKSVTWTVVASDGRRVAKNVILLIADGLSVGHRTGVEIAVRGAGEPFDDPSSARC